jgi:hypothetical protein
VVFMLLRLFHVRHLCFEHRGDPVWFLRRMLRHVEIPMLAKE